MKGAAHGFRNLSVIKILFGFEHRIKELKTKNDKIVNGKSGGEIVVYLHGIYWDVILRLRCAPLRMTKLVV